MKLSIATLIALASIVSAGRCLNYVNTVVAESSSSKAGLTKAVSRFRALLGGDDNGSAIGPRRRGHRSINWDGPGAPFNMPFDFFNTNVPRGAVFQTKGGRFAISNPSSAPPVDHLFSSLNRRAARNFTTFSSPRLFTPVFSNFLNTKFQIPGKKTPAFVSGFGAVFVDVNKRRTTTLALYDRKGCLIAKISVPERKRGLSFVGIIVRGIRTRQGVGRVKAPVSKVVMKLGDTPIVSKKVHPRNFKPDVVVTDDFIYGEPQL